MTAVEPIPLVWRDREAPLVAAAVVAHGPAADALARSTDARLLAGAGLGAASGDGYLIVVGDEADLPWADGATYLGWEASVLVPTTVEPVPRTALVADAARRTAGAHDLVVVLPRIVLRTTSPRPIGRGVRLADLIAT